VSVTVGLEALLVYSDHERAKWRDWIATDPARLSIALQPGGRFPTVADLLDHVFFVERRHLCRLEGGTPPDSTGVPIGDWQRLFEYAELVRADLRRYIGDLTDAAADGVIAWETAAFGSFSMSRRRLLTHILLHEVRHLAQVALAARTAGVEPPGNHDLIFFDGFA
jgi:uncharacterized damage-inducible protein DinB